MACSSGQDDRSTSPSAQETSDEVKPFEEFYTNGTLKTKGQYRKGMKTGLWTVYFDSGLKWTEEHYVSDKRNGVSTSYFPTGIMRMRGSYKNDERIGKWYFYDENGKVAKIQELEKK